MSDGAYATAIEIDQMAAKVAGRALWIASETGSYRVAGWDGARRVTIHPAQQNDITLLTLCDGTRSLQALAAELGISSEEAKHALRRWNERIPASFGWKPVEAVGGDSKRRAAARQMLRELHAVEDFINGGNDIHEYHVNGIGNALAQFEDVETTVSHAYGLPHAALGGRSYGQAFFDKCRELTLVNGPVSILEVGCGTGRFARAFLDRFAEQFRDAYDHSRYTLLDLSPTLTASQRVQCAPHATRVGFENGDIEQFEPARSFDLVIMNEMIADLSVTPLTLAEVNGGTPEAHCVVRYRLSLDGAMDRFVVNSGAIRVIERLRSWLSPAGAAVVCGYGSLNEFPCSIQLGEHVEYCSTLATFCR